MYTKKIFFYRVNTNYNFFSTAFNIGNPAVKLDY